MKLSSYKCVTNSTNLSRNNLKTSLPNRHRFIFSSQSTNLHPTSDKCKLSLRTQLIPENKNHFQLISTSTNTERLRLQVRT